MTTTKQTEEKAFNEMLDCIRWVARTHPEVYKEYMLICHICGKEFRVVKEQSGKYHKTYEPVCKCSKEKYRVSMG